MRQICLKTYMRIRFLRSWNITNCVILALSLHFNIRKDSYALMSILSALFLFQTSCMCIRSSVSNTAIGVVGIFPSVVIPYFCLRKEQDLRLLMTLS
jgi:hypothetical protein